jgi:pimeloyl-ACP methyl ester carboxylesterase
VSFGGRVALTYAALFPEVACRCIAVSAFAVGEELDEEQGGEAAAELEAAAGETNHGNAASTIEPSSARATIHEEGQTMRTRAHVGRACK